MKNRLTLIFILFITSVCFSQEPTKDLDSVSRELVNPVGSYWTISNYIQVNQKHGNITNEKRSGINWSIQAVTPIPLNESGLTLMNRPSLPIILYNPIPITNLNGEINFNNQTGVGDFTLLSALGKMEKTKWGMFMWGAGINLKFPTATNEMIGSGKYSIGPGGMLIGFTKNNTFGIVLQQLWSYAGSTNREEVNQTTLQFIYYFQLGNGWQIGDNPAWSFNWNAENGNKYDIPLGFGIYKTTQIGKTLLRLGITPRYYITSYEAWGNNWGVNFTISPVLKNPFTKKRGGMNKM